MKYTPLSSQSKSTETILTKKKSGLLVRMGVGKTVATLTAIEELLFNSFLVGRVLVVAPLLVATITWPEEIAKWDHLHRLSYVVLHGPKKDDLLPMASKVDLTIINYEGLNWLWDNRFKLKAFDMIVFDESTYLKNPTSARTILAHKIARPCDWVTILTGAPKPNGLENIWGQVFCLDRGQRLGEKITHFRNRYMYKVNEHIYKPRTGALEEVVELIADLCVVVEASEVSSLPKLTNRLVEFDLDPQAEALYKFVKQNSVIPRADGKHYPLVSDQAQMQKLRQLSSGFYYDEYDTAIDVHNSKVEALSNLRGGLPGTALIAIQYQYEVELVRRALGYEVPVINSSTKESVCRELILDWNNCYLPDLIVHPASLSHGINMQVGGRDLIWFGNTWDLEHWEQLIARLRRRGQLSPSGVTNYALVGRGTTDELMTSVIADKELSQEDFVKKVKSWKKKNIKRKK